MSNQPTSLEHLYQSAKTGAMRDAGFVLGSDREREREREREGDTCRGGFWRLCHLRREYLAQLGRIPESRPTFVAVPFVDAGSWVPSCRFGFAFGVV